MVVTVFGLGFVGLTTALGFAEKGVRVYGIEQNAERAESIAAGRVPFLEPGMDDALLRHLRKNFFVTSDTVAAVKESDCIFYCVGTPYCEGGEADLSYLYAAVDTTLPAMDSEKFRVMVIKSTIPPSTTKDRILPYIKENLSQTSAEYVGVANNPEFLREGCCWDDFLYADRIVLGVEDEASERMLKQLYAPFDIPVFAVSFNTAEYIKYLSNTMLATMISYSNEMAEIAHQIGGIQIADAFRVLHLDKRWGGCDIKSYVYPGCGYGGYCLPKDTNAIYALVNRCGGRAPILGAVIRMNEMMADIICDRIARSVDKDASIGILGLSFKPGSDDVRDTPAAKVIPGLLSRGYANISAYDPVAADGFQKSYHISVKCWETLEEIIQNTDALVILTAWEEFKDLTRVDKLILDCRYML